MQPRRTQFCESEEESFAHSPENAPDRSGHASQDRRAYYRVRGLLPIRVSPLLEEKVEAEIFDLSMPDPLLQPIGEIDEDAPLMARMRRIEEKLDLLLGAAQVPVSKQLSGRDRQNIVFSGSGVCLDVAHGFHQGDAYKVEILLPPPYCRLVRSVARCVSDAPTERRTTDVWPMALALDHMEPDERDALVAYSYDLQRFALRARQGQAQGIGDV